MPSHNDSSHSRAHALNILSARLGVSRKVLGGNVSLDIEGPAAHFYDSAGVARTITLPSFVKGGGTLYYVANVGASGVLNVVSAAALAVVTLSPSEAALIVSSESEWVASKSTAVSGAVFGASGPLHSTGIVPDPGAVAGTTKFLREDATWANPGFVGSDAFGHITDGSTTADASGIDTIKFRSSSGKVSAVVGSNDVTHGDNVNFSVIEAAIDHDALLNFVANKHIDHTTVSISAGAGLTGGGTIAATRTLSLDINGLTLDTPVLGDSFAFYDLSGGDVNKATLTTLNSILDHNALLNFVANKHIDHSLVSIQAGTGMSGGGDITATRTLNLDINGLTADTIAVGDFLPFYDISGVDHNKITLANLNGSLDHNSLLNYVANQHIDHTTVSISAGSGLSGGGTIAATRTLTLDINGLVADTPVSGDFFAFWDISGTDNNKVTLANLGTALGAFLQPLDATLTALAAFNTNGLLAQTAADTFAGRTITGTAAQITVANGDGVAGNPTLSFPVDILVPTILTVPNTGLHLLDTNASHDLIVKPGSDITADRTLTLTTGDADRTLTISASATISQDYSTTGNPQFATIELGAAADTTLARSSAGNVTIEGNLIYRAGGTDVPLADGGTGASLVDPNIDLLMGWDDSAGAVKFMALADINTEAAPASGDFLLMYDAAGNLLKTDWANIPVGGGGGSDPASGFRAHKNASDQNVATAAVTTISWGTESFDIAGEFVSDTYTVVNAGKYLLECSAHITAIGVGTTSIKLHLYKNGSLLETLSVTPSSLTNVTLQGSVIVNAAASDAFTTRIEFVGYASGTATIEGDATDSWFAGIRLAAGSGRTVLTTNTTYHISTTGSDAADGSSGTPWATLQHAYNYVAANLDLAGFIVTLQLDDGNYTSNGLLNLASSWTGGGSIVIQGNLLNRTAVNINAGVARAIDIEATLPGQLTLKFFQIENASEYAILFNAIGSLNINSIDFGACGSHIGQWQPSVVNMSGDYTIYGSTTVGEHILALSVFYNFPGTVTLTGTPNWATSFVGCSNSAHYESGFETYIGSATGKRFSVTNNATMYMYGAGINFLPGNQAGVQESGGRYDTIGVSAIDGSGNFSFGTTTPDRRLHVEQDSAATNTITPLARLTSTSQGTPAAGIGGSLEIEVETSTGNNEIVATTAAKVVNVTAASEVSDYIISTMDAGAPVTEKLRTGFAPIRLAQTSDDLVLLAGFGIYAPGRYEVPAGQYLEIGVDAVMEIGG